MVGDAPGGEARERGRKGGRALAGAPPGGRAEVHAEAGEAHGATVKRSPLPLARVPVFLWIPSDSLSSS